MGKSILLTVKQNIYNNLSVSLVLYNPKEQDLKRLFDSFKIVETKLWFIVVDNSPTDLAKKIVNEFGCEYIHNPQNNGFGGGHNIAMKLAMERNFKFNLILNPDIYFKYDVITEMTNLMNSDDRIGLLMPEILNEDLSIQFLPKLLPSPFDLLKRKINWSKSLYYKHLSKIELRYVSKEVVYNSPIISGCFMMVNLNAIKNVGLFDEKYFMYFEDWDLSRRIHMHYKTLYYPCVSVIHGYESGANKNVKLFFAYLNSAFRYFNKWGWLCDKERLVINSRAKSQF